MKPERYQLQCSTCHREIEFPAANPPYCPRCNAPLNIKWRDPQKGEECSQPSKLITAY